MVDSKFHEASCLKKGVILKKDLCDPSLVIPQFCTIFCTPISDQSTDQRSSQQPRGLLKNNQDLTIFSPKAGPMKDPRHVAPRIGAL